MSENLNLEDFVMSKIGFFLNSLSDSTILFFSIIFIAGFCLYDLNLEHMTIEFRAFTDGYTPAGYAIWVIAILAIPGLILLASRASTKNAKRAAMLLRYLKWSMLLVIASLAFKQFVFDPFLAEKAPEILHKGALKELFSFEVTLFSFLAGFTLLNALQEYSEVKKDRGEEIQHWHNMHTLFQFFQSLNGTPNTDELENHELAKQAVGLIESIDLLDKSDEKTPESVLRDVYQKIIRLDVKDDNDRPALNHLVDQYIKLNILINARKSSDGDAPNTLLVSILWVVGIITIAFADTAMFWTIEEGYSTFTEQAIGKLIMSMLLIVVIMPVTIIIMTISDLKNPNSGLWSIDMNERYRNMSSAMKQEE